MKELAQFNKLDLYLECELKLALQELWIEALAKGKIKNYTKDLYYQPKVTRFGELTPGTNEIITFIFRKFPFSFVGSHYAYNKMGLSTQIPNIITILTNENSLFENYSFKNIKINLFPFPITENNRKIYPILELLRGDFCFWEAETEENRFKALQQVIKKFTKEELRELNRLGSQYYSDQTLKVKALINC